MKEQRIKKESWFHKIRTRMKGQVTFTYEVTVRMDK